MFLVITLLVVSAVVSVIFIVLELSASAYLLLCSQLRLMHCLPRANSGPNLFASPRPPNLAGLTLPHRANGEDDVNPMEAPHLKLMGCNTLTCSTPSHERRVAVSGSAYLSYLYLYKGIMLSPRSSLTWRILQIPFNRYTTPPI